MPKEPTLKREQREDREPREAKVDADGNPNPAPAAEGKRAVKRVKKPKDPNAPKRPLSAYMYFSQDWRERIKTENPEVSFGEIGRLLGKKWKSLDEDEKKPYELMASRDKQRHETEKAQYERGAHC